MGRTRRRPGVRATADMTVLEARDAAVRSVPTAALLGRGSVMIVGLTLYTTSLTALTHGLDAVLVVGGGCGQGPSAECPGTATAVIPLGAIGMLLGGLCYAIAALGPTAPNLTGLLWPALFGASAVTFLRHGVQSPADPGLILCAAVLAVMGAATLAAALRPLGVRGVLYGLAAGDPRCDNHQGLMARGGGALYAVGPWTRAVLLVLDVAAVAVGIRLGVGWWAWALG